MNEQPSNLALYILMRTDMASLNPGKAVAQGSHATNQFVYDLHHRNDPEMETQFAEWSGQTPGGFGTALTLGVNGEQLRKCIETCQAAGFHANITHDPTYPLRDGAFTHLIPLDTCGYVFGDRQALEWYLGDLPLMA